MYRGDIHGKSLLTVVVSMAVSFNTRREFQSRNHSPESMIIGSRFQNRIISVSGGYPQGIITYCILTLLHIFLLLHACLRGINIKEQCLHPLLEGRGNMVVLVAASVVKDTRHCLSRAEFKCAAPIPGSKPNHYSCRIKSRLLILIDYLFKRHGDL